MEQERRKSPRFPFIASAEVRAEDNSSRLAARVSDISAAGCYVDTINPLPGGTLVRVRIFNETQSFEVAATVAYSVAHLGMGLKFADVAASSLSVLGDWLPATG
jgi:PilZ domain